MKLSYKRSLVAFGLMSIMVLPFTNCGQYSDVSTDNFSSSSSVDCSKDSDCIVPTSDNLSLKVNVGGGSQYDVPSGLSEFNLGGDCNEGGYPYNIVRWQLYLNGTLVRNSDMTGMTSSGNANSRCVNGRFLVYINLSAISADPVNRSGLMTGVGTNRASYDLYVEIYGMKSSTDTAPVRNSVKGRSYLSLGAI